MVDADARKPLHVLRDEWKDCTACNLSLHRQQNRGQFVFGEGMTRGVMFIGEGPGKDEENEGKPFVGMSGNLLRKVLNDINLIEHYITNIVACRSCEPSIDPVTQLQRVRKNALLFTDIQPLPVQIAACQDRLQQEIYIVDPIIIVTLGANASETLLGHPITITKQRGRVEHITIPGAMYEPVLTDKRRAWGRKSDGSMHWPIQQSSVRYLVLPTLHPAYVLRNLGDRGPKSAWSYFSQDIRFAASIYERYLVEALGIEPQFNPNADINIDGIHEEQD